MKIKPAIFAAAMIFTGVAFCQNTKPEPIVTVCSGLADNDCSKRETARLFFTAGKPDVALRVLCNTDAAMSSFRPNGTLDADKSSYVGLGACLKAVGLGRPEAAVEAKIK
jgi:hypothetical protein